MAKYIIEIPDEVPVSDELVPFDMCRPSWYSEAYEKGKSEAENEVWDFVRIITDMTECERKECFGGSTCDLDEYMTYQEARAKYEAWKKQKDEIHVGDEVGVDDTPVIGIVTKVDRIFNRYNIVSDDGSISHYPFHVVHKTGKHFHEVENLLKKMRGDKE